jgi:hypothetical protein
VLRPGPPPGEAPGGHGWPSGRDARGHGKGTRPDYPPPAPPPRPSVSVPAAVSSSPALVSDRRVSTRPGRTGPEAPGRWRRR